MEGLGAAVIQSQAGSELCSYPPILCECIPCSPLAQCWQVVGLGVGAPPRLTVLLCGMGSPAPMFHHRVEGTG